MGVWGREDWPAGVPLNEEGKALASCLLGLLTGNARMSFALSGCSFKACLKLLLSNGEAI